MFIIGQENGLGISCRVVVVVVVVDVVDVVDDNDVVIDIVINVHIIHSGIDMSGVLTSSSSSSSSSSIVRR